MKYSSLYKSNLEHLWMRGQECCLSLTMAFKLKVESQVIKSSKSKETWKGLMAAAVKGKN